MKRGRLVWAVRLKQKGKYEGINKDKGSLKKPSRSLLSCNPNKKYKRGIEDSYPA